MKNTTLLRMLTVTLLIFLTYPAVSAETLSIGNNFFEGQFTKSNNRILIKNVNIFDGKSERLLKKANLLIEGNLIKTISTSNIDAEDALIIEGNGKTLMPGLIDVHTHIAATRNPTEVVTWSEGKIAIAATTSAKQMLLRGFTTARDVGVNSIDLARAIDAGIVEGPRILPVGAIISTTSGPADYRGSNDGQPAFGANASQAAKLRFSYNVDGVDEAVTAGIKSIEHVSALNDELAKRIKQKGVWVVPSIVHCVSAQASAPEYFSSGLPSTINMSA
jgi:imidazolonepropionase-like amidohydrolase